jgi:hypothetical protein
MSQHAIASAIHRQLISDQSVGSVRALVGGRIHHLQAPPNTALPLVIVRLDKDQPQTFFDGSNDLRIEVVIEVQANDAATLLNASGRLFDQLHNQPLSIEGFRHATMRAVDRGREKADRDALTSTSRWLIIATTR